MKSKPGWLKGLDLKTKYPLSGKLINQVYEDKRLNFVERSLFVYMINYRSWIFPRSGVYVRKLFDIPERTYQRHVKTLSDNGFIYRSRSGNKHELFLAPPSEIYRKKHPPEAPARQKSVVGAKVIKSKKLAPAKAPARSTRQPTRKPRHMALRRKIADASVQKELFESSEDRTGPIDFGEFTPPKDIDELYNEFLIHIDEKYGSGTSLKLPGTLEGQNRSRWREKLSHGEQFGPGVSIVRLLVWDWEKARDLWPKAFGQMPIPSVDAIWKLADPASPFTDVGITGKSTGRNRGAVSEYAKKFLDVEEDRSRSNTRKAF